jgi:serine/threonine-protein kinase RsbT
VTATAPTVQEVLTSMLPRLVPPRAVPSILKTLPDAAVPVGSLDVVALNRLVAQVVTGLRLFGGSPTPATLRDLKAHLAGGRSPRARQVHIHVSSDADVLAVQMRVQELCRGFFNSTDCVKLATAASELARNIYLYARQGTIDLTLDEDAQGARFEVVAADQGPGIENLESILSGNYQSKTGLGRGLAGSRKLLDGLEVETGKGRGTRVRGWKRVRR